MATPAPRHRSGFHISAVVPILGWIRTYNRSRLLRPDVLAGVTVAAFSVPESMAYAGLAGLTPEHGLYASMVALLVYACFGTSRHMSVGTTSALSIMVAGTLGGLALTNPDDYLAAAQLTAIFAGIIAVVAGLLKLGFVVNFISESVLTGFSAGAALFIASSQLAKLFGIEGVQGNFFERVWNVLKHLDETNGWTLALGLTSIALLLILERFFPACRPRCSSSCWRSPSCTSPTWRRKGSRSPATSRAGCRCPTYRRSTRRCYRPCSVWRSAVSCSRTSKASQSRGRSRRGSTRGSMPTRNSTPTARSTSAQGSSRGSRSAAACRARRSTPRPEPGLLLRAGSPRSCLRSCCSF